MGGIDNMRDPISETKFRLAQFYQEPITEWTSIMKVSEDHSAPGWLRSVKPWPQNYCTTYGAERLIQLHPHTACGSDESIHVDAIKCVCECQLFFKHNERDLVNGFPCSCPPLDPNGRAKVDWEDLTRVWVSGII